MWKSKWKMWPPSSECFGYTVNMVELLGRNNCFRIELTLAFSKTHTTPSNREKNASAIVFVWYRSNRASKTLKCNAIVKINISTFKSQKNDNNINVIALYFGCFQVSHSTTRMNGWNAIIYWNIYYQSEKWNRKKWEDWFTIVRMTNERMKELKALISFFVVFDVQHTESRQRYPSYRVSFRKKLITKSHDYSDYFPFKQRFFLNSLFLSHSLHFFTANRLILFQWVHVTKLISKFWISHMNIYFFFRVLVFDPNPATSMHESAFWWRWTKKSMRLYKNRRNYRAQSGVKPAQKISIMWKKRIIEGCNRQSQFTPSTFRVAI